MQILESANVEQIKELLKLGFGLVPSNIPQEDGKQKVPWKDWKKIVNRLNLVSLYDLLLDWKADSVAVLAGKLSGNLVLVDVDTKYKKGFEATLFKDLGEYFPEIWNKVRLEKTISGGYHLMYRVCLKDIEGCDHLFPSFSGAIASRYATESELKDKPRTGKYGFIELKNICQVYPSPGYSVIKSGLDEDGWWSANLSWEEHCCLLKLLEDYDELFEDEVKKPVKVKSDIDDYYEENPFSHFNNGNEKESVLERLGWVFKKSNGKWNYYTRPESKTKGDDAIYNTKSNFYKIYTTSSSLEDKGYSPIGLLIAGMFGGKKDECYAWLVNNGYGKIKPSKEKWIVKKEIARGGKVENLPGNISVSAKEGFEEEKKKLNVKYPFGVFWNVDEDGRVNINREDLYRVSKELGFRSNGNDVCLISEHVVEIVDERKYFDRIKKYLDGENENEEDEVGNDVKSEYESFLQKSGKFTISRLPVLDQNELLKSNKKISYKGYKNGYLKIWSEGYEFLSYNNLDKLIWKHQIQNRDFKEVSEEEAKNGLYYRFLNKALGGVSEHVLKCIGYYAHDYKSTSTPYIVVLCEMCDDAKKGGGSGKNIFTNLLKLTTSLLNKPAKNVKFDDTLLRTWKGQKVLSFNEADKKFDYLGTKELSSGEGEVGKKFHQELTISNRDMPKLIINTNYSFDPSLPGLKRRLIPLEFTSFFTLCGGVDVFFGKEFPSDNESDHDWKEIDFNSFDFVVINAIQEFLKGGCKLTTPPLTDGGWLKQFEGRFHRPTYLFIRENINTWLELEKVRIKEVFNVSLKDFYDENNVDKPYRLSSFRINEALQEYCDHYNIEFIASKNLGRLDGIQINAKIFIKHKSSNAIEEEKEFEEESEKEELPF